MQKRATRAQGSARPSRRLVRRARIVVEDGFSGLILLYVGAAPGALEAPNLARELVRVGHRVEVILKEKARLFVGPSSFATVGAKVVERASEPPRARLYFPATTGIIARLSRGFSGEAEAADEMEPGSSCFVVPEVDAGSACNPAVAENIETLRRDGVRVVGVAGDEVESRSVVANELLGYLAASGGGRLAGRRVVVTAGGTHEPIDSVRFIGNRSSGKMGLAVAREARLMGAEVVVISANIPVREPGVEWIPVQSVSDMERAVGENLAGADALVMAAAVSDFTPVSPVEEKIRRGASETMTLELTATSDILGGIRGEFPELLIVGFAATHGDPVPDAREKLARKGADFIVGNDISRRDIGFATEENEVVIVGGGTERFVKKAGKNEVARAILDEVAAKLREVRSDSQ